MEPLVDEWGNLQLGWDSAGAAVQPAAATGASTTGNAQTQAKWYTGLLNGLGDGINDFLGSLHVTTKVGSTTIEAGKRPTPSWLVPALIVGGIVLIATRR